MKLTQPPGLGPGMVGVLPKVVDGLSLLKITGQPSPLHPGVMVTDATNILSYLGDP